MKLVQEVTQNEKGSEFVGKHVLVQRFIRALGWHGNCSSAWYSSMSARSIEQVPEHPKKNGRIGCIERRRRSRIQVHWPVRFLNGETVDIVETVTRDLSSDGFYCLAKMLFVPGELKVCT